MKRLLAMAIAALTIGFVAEREALASTERRVALVIGNKTYEHATMLNNSIADARAMAGTLERLGFHVIAAYDTTIMEMNAAVEEFAHRSQTADVSLFFYAGHGIGALGTNYLLPVDALINSPTALRTQALDITLITDAIRFADSVGLVFLDACRDNPFADQMTRGLSANVTRSIGRAGLTEMQADVGGKGLAIAFATSPGQVAYDGFGGGGQHSPFTQALLKYMAVENMDVGTMMSSVTGEVLRTTREQQRPWFTTSLTGPVILNPARSAIALPADVTSGVNSAAVSPAPAPSASPNLASLEEQRMVFEVASKVDRIDQYDAYLRMFPNGLFATAAHAAIERLRAEEASRIQTAALSPAAPVTAAPVTAAPAVTPAVVVEGPLVLPVTDVVKAAPATEFTENALEMDRPKRREVQLRLNAVGANVGGADGLFGPRTRGGISTWQQQTGLAPTGYLNALQLQLLMARTEGQVEAMSSAEPVAAAAPASVAPRQRARTQRARAPQRQQARRTTTRRTTQRQAPRRNAANDAAAAAAAAAIIGTIIGTAVRRR